MRVGFNPNKDKILPPSDFTHQVIVPVYIPHQSDYFKDSLQILQWCLESLFKTSHAKTYFTIINNGSCNEVVEYLNQLHQEYKIQEIIHTTAIGKLNAILKGLTGHQFPLITITDADVLFLNNWQKATYEVFEAFPKAGVVSPVPNPKNLKYYTANLIGTTFFSKSISFRKVVSKGGMAAFAKSIGNVSLYKAIHFEKQLTINKDNVIALVGAGHFVATYKGVGFDLLKQRFSEYSLGGDSVRLLLDKPPTDLGLWRLSTQNNYAYHLGNVKEDWMQEEFDKITFDSAPFECSIENKVYSGILNNFYMRFFSRLIFRKPFWQLYLRYKGLTLEEAKQY
ncbi:glycosyltransferase family A protein [Flavobacterium cucumis]|uniref:Glycosyl transferase family 2 n=1 Tax=Flavobacterium cucumis TaxID=416016 RepID=A0A1M7ZUN9_9FLAO|nr:glycosyltransferase family A protein [Flavobacterium cucumis]SHO72523.1 Glycosyl transferase family 2 [Flavobacterium cucumis]